MMGFEMLENIVRKTRAIVPVLATTLALGAATAYANGGYPKKDPCNCKEKPKIEQKAQEITLHEKETVYVRSKPDTVYIGLDSLHIDVDMDVDIRHHFPDTLNVKHSFEKTPAGQEESREKRGKWKGGKQEDDEREHGDEQRPTGDTKSTIMYLEVIPEDFGKETADFSASASMPRMKAELKPKNVFAGGGFIYATNVTLARLSYEHQKWRGTDVSITTGPVYSEPASYKQWDLSFDFIRAIPLKEQNKETGLPKYFTPGLEVKISKNDTTDEPGFFMKTETSISSIAGKVGAGIGKPKKSHGYGGLLVQREGESSDLINPEVDPTVESTGWGVGPWIDARLNYGQFIVDARAAYVWSSGEVKEPDWGFGQETLNEWDKSVFHADVAGFGRIFGPMGVMASLKYTHTSKDTEIEGIKTSEMDADKYRVGIGIFYEFTPPEKKGSDEKRDGHGEWHR